MSEIFLPPSLRGVFFDRLWERSKLWALPTASTPMPVTDLAWHVHLPVWSTVPGQPRFDLSPADVLADPEAFPRHWAKILRADLLHPLEMFRNGERWVIVDGYHRLARALREDEPTVRVRLHPDDLWTLCEPKPSTAEVPAQQAELLCLVRDDTLLMPTDPHSDPRRHELKRQRQFMPRHHRAFTPSSEACKALPPRPGLRENIRFSPDRLSVQDGVMRSRSDWAVRGLSTACGRYFLRVDGRRRGRVRQAASNSEFDWP